MTSRVAACRTEGWAGHPLPVVLARALVAALALGAVAALPAQAQQAETPDRQAIMLNVLSSPSESRETAFDQWLKDEGPAPRALLGVVQPDGSVRYGNVTVTVREACPQSADLGPPPLPGRRARH